MFDYKPCMYIDPMYLEIIDESAACSTLIVSNFNENRTLERFKEDFLKLANKMINEEDYYFCDFAFCTASTEVNQINTTSYLKALGFKSSRKIWNAKNETCVQFWLITIPSLMKSLGYTQSKRVKYRKNNRYDDDWYDDDWDD